MSGKQSELPLSMRPFPMPHNKSFQPTIKKLRFLPSAEFQRWASKGVRIA